MSTEELPPRESMEFDVVIVGAGPSGLSAAIRLKQLNADLNVVVVEKGSEVGAHILSGAVIDPAGLDKLVPDWREDSDCPLKTQVKDDRFYWMTGGGAIKLPNFMMPPLMDNHHCYIGSLGNVCRWLARKAEALGVEIYPGFAAAEVLYDEEGKVRGIATGDMGIGRDGKPKDSFTRGMELLGKYTLFAEGARGSLTKQLIAKFALDAKSEPAKFGIGLKEVWQIDPAKHQKGMIQHSFGWPLDLKTGGGSFLYHYDDNLVAVGFVVHLNYDDPYLSPFDEFQRFKTHPSIRGTFEGGKRLAYGARAITEGGYQSVPKLSFPGGALIGCAAGFVNVPRIKGVHNAMGTGMLAAEHVAVALAADRANDEIVEYENAWRSSSVGKDLFLARNVKPLWSKFGTVLGVALGGLDMWCNTAVRRLAVRYPVAFQARSRDARSGQEPRAEELPEAGRQDLVRQAVVGIPVQHQSRGGPAGPSPGCRHEPPEDLRARRVRRSLESVLPGRRLRVGGGGGEPALPDQRPELRPLQNLRREGPQRQHHLGSAGGRRRSELRGDVRAGQSARIWSQRVICRTFA
ncbi:electron-transferring-flavoprotein dehydrogenase [Bradyrhizobium diazoefficiens]